MFAFGIQKQRRLQTGFSIAPYELIFSKTGSALNPLLQVLLMLNVRLLQIHVICLFKFKRYIGLLHK